MEEKLPHYLIYMYIFPNGKKYIGKSTKPLSQRQGRDWTKYETCTLLWKAIQKYGTENIRTEILFEGDITHEEAAELERKYIAEYKTNVNRYKNPQYGYNLTDGGEGLVGWHPSPERYEQMMQQLVKAQEVRLANGVSEATKQKMREAKLGKKYGPMSEEQKKKISESHLNISDEEKERRRKMHIKSVLVTNTETGEQMIFDSRKSTAEYFGVADSTISGWIGGYKKSTYPYKLENYEIKDVQRLSGEESCNTIMQQSNPVE